MRISSIITSFIQQQYTVKINYSFDWSNWHESKQQLRYKKGLHHDRWVEATNRTPRITQRRRGNGGAVMTVWLQAAFFAALTCAHLARCAAAILRLPPRDKCFWGAPAGALPAVTDC
jgi:hypothetical protein